MLKAVVILGFSGIGLGYVSNLAYRALLRFFTGSSYADRASAAPYKIEKEDSKHICHGCNIRNHGGIASVECCGCNPATFIQECNT